MKKPILKKVNTLNPFKFDYNYNYYIKFKFSNYPNNSKVNWSNYFSPFKMFNYYWFYLFK